MKPRVIAFYLPQFHPIPENDAHWGRGFTEWTNVRKAKRLYPGHQQPRQPSDLGYYDLRDETSRIAQADLARQFGVEGFCYWHYWFGGDRLLERPFEEVLSSGKPDFPFCLAWANESWTGIWHGAPNKIIKAQTYPGKKDHEAHFAFLLRAFKDPRYLTVDGKPMFLVLNPKDIPDVRSVAELWKSLATEAELKGIHLVAIVEQEEPWDPRDIGFDAVANSNQSMILNQKKTVKAVLKRPYLSLYRDALKSLPRLHHYKDAIKHFIVDKQYDFPVYPSAIAGWDNSPRCGSEALILHGVTPKLFKKHFKKAVSAVSHLPEEHQIVFLKSWNEWAEGNYVEPDAKHGTGFLEAIRDSLELHRLAEPLAPRPL